MVLKLPLLSVLVAFGWEVSEYLQSCPDGLENTSPRAQRIAHLQRTKWEFELAKILLAQRLGPIDREYTDLLNNATFVSSERPEDLRAYLRWIGSRHDNLFKMLEVAQQLMLRKLPLALVSTKDKAACPKAILSAVESLVIFYRDTVEFERQSRTVLPPPPFRRLHELQFGWTQPIRDAVLQLFQLMQQICDVDADTNVQIAFTITFPEPPRVNEFCAELNSLETQLPEILADW